MKIKFCYILTLFMCSLVSMYATAQHIAECATPFNMPDPLANMPASKLHRIQAGTTLMRMYIHICRNNDGSNQPMTQAAVEDEVRITDSVYSQGDICFAIAGVDYINSTTLNNAITSSALTPYLVANCFNVFVVSLIPSAVGTTFGTAFDIPNNYIAIVPSGFGARRTFIHELGHDLGLFHTFRGQPFESGTGTCKELVNGSNNTTCGDFVADTPADPYDNGDNTTCNSVSNTCVWNGTCKDANNQLYSPNTHNYMGYWPNAGAACDRNIFSNGQFTRMQNTITNTTILSNCVAANALNVYNSSASSGLQMVVARDLVQAGNIFNTGNYTLSGSVQAYLTSSKVDLKPGFTAVPSSAGIVRVLATTCQ